MKPLLVAFDLEFNQPSERIIQVGAAIGDLERGVLSRLSVYVNPNEPLNPEISDLCGIVPQALELAGTLAEAYELLRAWLAPFDQERQLNPLTWGGGDSARFRSELRLDDERWLFGRRWIDVKTLYTAIQHARGKDGHGGMARSMRREGLQVLGRVHDAADDAVNTFRMYRHLLVKLRAGVGAA